MTDDARSNPYRKDPITGDTDITSPTKSAYNEWSTERLVDCYRRNSILLREYGPDERTIRTLCAIEERLRARNIDPDHIVEELDA